MIKVAPQTSFEPTQSMRGVDGVDVKGEWLMYFELNTERLLLRPLDLSDLRTLYEYTSDVENTKYMLFYPFKRIEETRSYLARVTAEWQKQDPSFYEFAVIYDSVHIGTVSVYFNEDRTEGELACILNKKYWGRGFATEAARAIKSFIVEQLKVKKLVAHCDCRNLNSAHVMEKIGLSFDGKDERQYPDERGSADELQYSCEIFDV
jgi:ribosomal-protein-alanine N-acetyltransferase